MKPIKIAIVGATGLVGQTMLKCIEGQIPQIDSQHLILVASDASAEEKKEVRFRGINLPVISVSALMEQRFDVVLMSVGEELSKKYAPLFLQKGAYVIDNSPAWRMESDVSLSLPWTKLWKLSDRQKLFSVPNCVAVMLATVIYPLLKLKPTTISAIVMQSVSGAGQIGIDALQFENLENIKHPDSPFLFQVANNIQIATKIHKTQRQFNGEEYKVITELPKILGESINISPRCFRSPTIEGHFADITIEVPREVSYRQVAGALRYGNHVIYKNEQVSVRDVIMHWFGI
jgi:aspartate-semialdehyde dehydrogenase